MVTKMKKKCSSVSKDSGKKGQFLVVGTTIKIVLIVMVLVVGMSILATQKDKMASISDTFLDMLAKLGFLHLSDDDAIALASMQATACAVDVVAKYSDDAVAFNEADNIFDGIESCDAQLFEDTASWSGGPSTEQVVVDEDGELITTLTGDYYSFTFEESILNHDIVSDYECSGNNYDVVLVEFSSDKIKINISYDMDHSDISFIGDGGSFDYEDLNVTMTNYVEDDWVKDKATFSVVVDCL